MRPPTLTIQLGGLSRRTMRWHEGGETIQKSQTPSLCTWPIILEWQSVNGGLQQNQWKYIGIWDYIRHQKQAINRRAHKNGTFVFMWGWGGVLTQWLHKTALSPNTHQQDYLSSTSLEMWWFQILNFEPFPFETINYSNEWGANSAQLKYMLCFTPGVSSLSKL